MAALGLRERRKQQGEGVGSLRGVKGGRRGDPKVKGNSSPGFWVPERLRHSVSWTAPRFRDSRHTRGMGLPRVKGSCRSCFALARGLGCFQSVGIMVAAPFCHATTVVGRTALFGSSLLCEFLPKKHNELHTRRFEWSMRPGLGRVRSELLHPFDSYDLTRSIKPANSANSPLSCDGRSQRH